MASPVPDSYPKRSASCPSRSPASRQSPPVPPQRPAEQARTLQPVRQFYPNGARLTPCRCRGGGLPILILCAIGAIALPLGALIAQISRAILRRGCLMALVLAPFLLPALDNDGAWPASVPVSLVVVVTLFVFALPIGTTVMFGLVGYYLGRLRIYRSDAE